MTFDLHYAMWTVIVLFALCASFFVVGGAIAARLARFQRKWRERQWWE